MPPSHLHMAVVAGVVATEVLWVGIITWSLLDLLFHGKLIDSGEMYAILVASLLTGIGAWLAEYSRGAAR